MASKRKVFISYAHKDSSSAEVGELVRWLNAQEGIEVVSDHLFPHRAPPQGWYAWMQHSIEAADIVLCICGKVFKEGFEKRGGGKGATFEGGIVNVDLYESYGWNEKFHPILPAGEPPHVPKGLQPWDNNVVVTQRERILHLIRAEQSAHPDMRETHEAPASSPVKAETAEKKGRKGSLKKRAALLGVLVVTLGIFAAMVSLSLREESPRDNLLGVHAQVAKALLSEGHALDEQGKTEKAIAVYDDIVRRFDEDEASVVREQVAMALCNKSHALMAMGKTEEAIAVHEEIARRFGEDESPVLREEVAEALFNKSHALMAMGKAEEAIAVYEEIARRFEEDESPVLREGATRALFSKGHVLGKKGKTLEAVAVYDFVALRFGGDESPVVREQAAKALYYKISYLGGHGETEKALKACNEMARRFGNDSSPNVRTWATEALELKRGFENRKGARQ